MKALLFMFVLFFGFSVAAQQSPLSADEFERLTKFEGSQVAFVYSDLLSHYIYETQSLNQSPTNTAYSQVKLKAFLKLKQVDEDTYCFSDLYFGFNVRLRGQGCVYDSVTVAIGFTTNIRRGDAILYHFGVKSDAEGNSFIGGYQIEEIISKSMEINRPLTFYFFNQNKPIGESMIPYAKVGQKLGGIIKTRNNLLQKYVLCDE